MILGQPESRLSIAAGLADPLDLHGENIPCRCRQQFLTRDPEFVMLELVSVSNGVLQLLG